MISYGGKVSTQLSVEILELPLTFHQRMFREDHNNTLLPALSYVSRQAAAE